MLQNVRNLSTFSALPQKNYIEKIGKLNFRGLKVGKSFPNLGKH